MTSLRRGELAEEARIGLETVARDANRRRERFRKRQLAVVLRDPDEARGLARNRRRQRAVRRMIAIRPRRSRRHNPSHRPRPAPSRAHRPSSPCRPTRDAAGTGRRRRCPSSAARAPTAPRRPRPPHRTRCRPRRALRSPRRSRACARSRSRRGRACRRVGECASPRDRGTRPANAAIRNRCFMQFSPGQRCRISRAAARAIRRAPDR